VVPYLLLCREDAPQREYSLRAVFKGLRYLVRTGCQWRYLPHDLPPWPVIYQQTQRWIESHCFETMVWRFITHSVHFTVSIRSGPYSKQIEWVDAGVVSEIVRRGCNKPRFREAAGTNCGRTADAGLLGTPPNSAILYSFNLSRRSNS
jgi:transposase